MARTTPSFLVLKSPEKGGEKDTGESNVKPGRNRPSAGDERILVG